MEKKQISMLVTAMFAGIGIMGAAGVHAQSNFVDRGNPDNALNGQCIDGTNPLCVATKSGQYVAVSTAKYVAGNNAQAGSGGIAIGDRANANSKDTSSGGGGATAIGVGAQALANSATAIGTVALAQGNTALAIGRQSAAVGDYSMALGNVADAHGKSSIALGHSALAQGDRSVAIGGANPTTSDGVSNGASYDAVTQTRAGGTQSVAIGAGAQTNGDNQIAIGSGSVGAANNTSTPVFGGTAAPVGGAVSFGAIGKERQLKNVAAGVDATDAVNISQLKSVNDGLTTSISNVDSRVTNLSTTVGGQITNINNSLSTAATNITNLQAADQLNVKYTDGTHTAISLDGNGGTTIGNVKAGVADTDAVNVGQLNGGLSSLSTSVTNNINTQISTLSTTINNQIGAATKNAVQYDTDDHTSVTLGGADHAPVKLSNVADGVANNDAVNVGQLNGAISPIQTSLSSAVTNITNLQGDVTNLSTSLGTTNQNVTNLSTSLAGTQTDVSNLQAADKRNVKYDGAEGFETVTLAGPSGTKVTNVKAAELSATSTDAVNGSQLYATNQTVATQGESITQIGGQVTQNTTNIDALKQDALQWSASAGAYDASHGSGSAQKITNVAAGDVSATSTDAINGAQLKNVQDQINTQIGGATKNAVVYDTDANGNRQNSVTLAGGAAGPVKLSNVADGVANNDAVNVGQLTKSTGNLQQQITTQGDTITSIDQRVTTNTTSISTLKQDALQWNATLGTYDASHGSGAPQRIGNVAQGEKGTDAVNVDQLNAAVQTGVGALDSLAVKYDDASKRQVSLGAGNGGIPVRVTNVAEGGVYAGSTDAVNGSQLRYATDGVAAALGGGASANSNGSINAPTYNVDGDTYHNVGDALGNLDGRVAGNTTTIENHETRIGNAETNITNNTTAIWGLQKDALQFDPAIGAYNAARGGVATTITNVADGSIAAGSKDAVNGGQLFGVKTDLEQQITNVSSQTGEAVKNVVKYDVDASGNRLNSVSLVGGNAASPVVLKNVAAGVDDTDAVNVKQLKSVQSSINQIGAMAVTYDDSSKSIITLGGGAGGTKITNVQAGTLNATSTDAVNGSQLYATNQQVAKNTTDITNLQENVTNVTNGKAGLVQQQDPNGQITVGAGTGGTSVNFAGNSGADRVLTGVAAGVNNNDAVNVGQLDNALKDVRTNQNIKAAATDANTTWIARADAGSFGTTATATGKNAVAVGQGSVADRDNSFSVGAKGSERQVTNVAAGTAPTDAVNVQQLNDNVAAASAASRGYTDQRVGQMYNDLNTVKKDMFGGVASAMAVAGLPQPTAPGRSMVSAATSNYHGQQGFAAGYSYVTQNDKWVVKASVTGNSRSDFGAVVGAGYQF
ncbi:YadA family autotransporter adhesin [Burkholderia sp. PU8-34]